MGRRSSTTGFGNIGRRALVAALLATTAAAAGMTASTLAQAQTSYSVPAGPLNRALATFGSQSGTQISYEASIVRGKSSKGVSRAAMREQAIAQLLQGTGLTYSFTDATSLVISAPAAGSGAVAPDGSVQLQTIQIYGASSASADNNTVAAKDSSAATKLDTPLIETARSVSVVTRKEMDQRGVQDILEAVRYSAGVTTGRSGFDPRFDAIEIRGYDATTMGDYKDGLRQPYLNYGMFRTDPYSLERVEIVKGPVSVLYGAGTPAGIINKVSKFANGNRIREVETFYGTKDRKQFAFDIGDRLGEGDQLSYRLVGLARAGETNFDIADDRYFLQPSFTWTPSAQTRLTVYGLVQSTETDGSISALTDQDGKVHDIRTSDPDYDYQKIRQQQIGYEFEHEFNDLLTLKQNLRYSHLDLRGRYLDRAGWTGTVLHRSPWAVKDKMDVFQADNQLEWTFDTGPLSHKLLTGLDYTTVRGAIGYGFGPADPAYDLDIANPTSGVSGPTAGYDFLQVDRKLRQTGLYAVDQMKIDNWHFSLGGRQTWVEQNAEGSSGGVAIADDVRKNAFTMQAGILYAFDNGISPYASYATSFDPVTSRSVSGEFLDPTEGEQFELGVKYQPPGTDILLSAAAYHLVEKNKPVVVDAAAQTYRSLGEVTNKGVELEARANVANGLDVIAAYTYVHSRITAGTDVGNAPAVKPEHIVSLWGNYTFDEASVLSGLSAGAGIRYASAAYTSTKNTAKNDATFYLDAALTYDFGAIDHNLDGLTAAFNVRNITDRRDTLCNEGYCSLAQGRNITGSLKYRW